MRNYSSAVARALTATAVAAQSQPTRKINEAPAHLRPVIARADLMIAAMQDSGLRMLVDAFEGDRYPADRATGFKEGEIRGWFWVEVAKKPR